MGSARPSSGSERPPRRRGRRGGTHRRPDREDRSAHVKEENPGLATELRKLAGFKRTRRNFETVKAQVEELQEHSEDADEVLTTLTALRESITEFDDALNSTGEGNPLLQAFDGIGEAVSYLMSALPGEYDEDIREIIEESAQKCEAYE